MLLIYIFISKFWGLGHSKRIFRVLESNIVKNDKVLLKIKHHTFMFSLTKFFIIFFSITIFMNVIKS